jgi:hypothetical protein
MKKPYPVFKPLLSDINVSTMIKAFVNGYADTFEADWKAYYNSGNILQIDIPAAFSFASQINSL